MAKKQQSKKRTGFLYRRVKGKDYGLDDPEGAGGIIWLQYRLHGKMTRLSLKTADVKDAEQKRDEIMDPLRSADVSEAYDQLVLKASQAKKKLDEALEGQIPILPLADAWQTYTSPAYEPDCGTANLKRYKSHFDALTEWLADTHSGITKLNEINTAVALEFSAYISSKFGPNTFNKYMNFLCRFYKTLKEPGAIEINPWTSDLIKRKRLTGKTNSKREFTLQELKTLLENCQGDEHTLHAIGAFTGMRLGDCATLKWSEIDLDRCIITRTPNKTKHTSGERIKIGIPPYLFGILSDIPLPKRKGYVLPDIHKLYETDQAALSRKIQAHFIKCGIETVQAGTGEGTKKRAIVDVGFHSYRHTYVSLHAMAGTPMAHVQQLAGHSNPAMTDHYTHISDAAVIQYAQALPDPFKADNTKPTVKDADFEVIEDRTVPDWILEKLRTQTADNWESVRDEVVGGRK